MCTGPHDFIPVPNVVEARMQYETFGGQAENVLHYRNGGGAWTPSLLDDLGAAMVTAWNADIADKQSSDVQLLRIVIKDLTAEGAYGIEHTGFLPQAGQVIQPALPNSVTMAIKKTTGFTGRSFRGRIYHIGSYESAVILDEYTDAYRNDVVAGYQSLMTLAITGDTAHMVVVSYCQDGEWLTEGVATDVIDMSADRIVDSQRRRLKGRGR